MTDDLPTVSVGLVAGRAMSASLIVPADVASGNGCSVVSLDQARRQREERERLKKLAGNCGRNLTDACGMIDSTQCVVHGTARKPDNS